MQNVSPWIKRWLEVVLVMIVAMVVVGGATRLTGSGLSITEWKPIMGAIPPLNEADWLAAFDKYKQSSQFKLQNSAFALADFQFIFWWEWAHRFLGRLIGLVVAVPLLFFAWRRMLPTGLWPKIIVMLILGGLQGALGWYMVASGLVDRVSVTQYRLAAHLTLAAVIFVYVLWLRLSLANTAKATWRLSAGIVALVLLQIALGGFVAGLNAGQGYNTWPLMDGAIIPQGLLSMQPFWLNGFENALTVQFNHRLLAYLIFAITAYQAVKGRGWPQIALFVTVLVQVAIGIATLLWHVPLSAALTHQAWALVVLACAVWNWKVASAHLAHRNG